MKSQHANGLAAASLSSQIVSIIFSLDVLVHFGQLRGVSWPAAAGLPNLKSKDTLHDTTPIQKAVFRPAKKKLAA